MPNTNYQLPKSCVLIEDITGYGKCATTVALPIMSAMGIETSILPTALLSTHPAGLGKISYFDLTENMRKIIDHWKTLNLHFDGILTGFLGSESQIDIVKNFFDLFKNTNNFIAVDPVMADNGKLYSTMNDTMVEKMRSLCSCADLIIPNLTEAFLLTGKKWHDAPYAKEEIEQLLENLMEIGCKNVVITGISFENSTVGAVCYDKKNVSYYTAQRIEGQYHGTGDIFSTVLTGNLLNGKNLYESMKNAVNFTQQCINETFLSKRESKYGVIFEPLLKKLY